MFRKILIANRGEIACRVIATARKLGIKTVAVYSDADATAKHVAIADEAVHVGGSAVADSYLRADRIIDAALKTGAQAIHPGYGFLSENPDFVDALTAQGLVFIGPSADAIRAMGLKDAAKELMEKAGVPVVPGYHGAEQDPDFLATEADKIGYPVLIKARAGGGGKGMRLVEDPAEFRTALEGAQREGQASFGDPACLIEKFVTHPRHIEIQVFGDNHGNAVHMFERDCSLQRRHQKVIEEAPAPDMPQAVRDAMGQAAVDAAKAIGYAGAGTIEFIVDGSGPLRTDGFWFMEMNTRLQVEHPVSEAITGKDFVELQLQIASGDPIPFDQSDLTINGWSFEARVYAEDVPKGFLPATGTLEHLKFPQGTEFSYGATRIDSGVRDGDEISPWYDPMIAKVIVHGPSRTAALNALSTALEQCHVAGSTTNLAFLGALSNHAAFARGEVDTGLIARDIESLTEQVPPSNTACAAAGLSALGFLDATPADDPWGRIKGWQHWSASAHRIVLTYEDEPVEMRAIPKTGNCFDVIIDGQTITLSIKPSPHETYRIERDGQQFQISLVNLGKSICIFEQGRSYSFGVPDPLVTQGDHQAGGDAILAPMPGLVKVVSAEPGQSVKAGDPILVLEAMKMEHTLNAPRDGTIAEVLAAVGDQVADGTVLVSLEPQDD